MRRCTPTSARGATRVARSASRYVTVAQPSAARAGRLRVRRASPTAAPTRSRPTRPIEGGRSADGDRHVIVVDRGRCRLYELYDAHPRGGRRALASGLRRDLEPASNRAAPARAGPRPTPPACRSCPGWPATTRSSAGAIGHALRFTVSRTRRAYVWPARHYASDLTDPDLPADGPAAPPEGRFDISGFPPPGPHHPAALKTLRDDPGRQRLAAGSSPARPSTAGTTTTCTRSARVPGSAFEVVDTSRLARPPAGTH